MKVRNNTNGDYSIVFADGHSISLSRGEVSRELKEEEICDPFFSKDLKQKRVVVFTSREPITVLAPPPKVISPIEKKILEEILPEKKTVVIKKGRKDTGER